MVAVGLLIALFATKKQADDQRAKDADGDSGDLSNQLDTASLNLNDQRQVNLC